MTYLLLFYLLFLFLYAIYSTMGVYHLLKFGYVGDMTKVAALVYLLLSLSVIIFSFVLLSEKLIT